jgi:adenine-specific DNA-methyltransferase
MDVPYKVLEHSYGFSNGTQTATPTGSGNKIIHGDNLEALKSLLPEYEGKIKCIYIDPPYNTGNEGWVYNDNVNDPKLKKWLGQVVGKESEDLSRHDKWLCMMYPRLKLLHKLLADDGAIFISIDDNEQAHLKLICDEIFGGGNFISNIIWEKNYSPRNDSKYLSASHDFIVLYTKSKNYWNRNLLSRTEKQNKMYKNLDNDPRGLWQSDNLTVKTYSKEYDYEIIAPDGRVIRPPQNSCWRVSKERFSELLNDNRIWFGKDGKNTARLKRFLHEVQDGIVPQTIWKRDDVGDSQSSKKDILKIFENEGRVFETPKSISLVERILDISSDSNSIILDSFAGSGTTAHAVLNLNKQDGGNRKFICIEMEEYAETITAERVKRVINGYGSASSPQVEGTGGSFDFYELGPPLFLEDGSLNELLGIDRLREYIWYTETQTALTPHSYTDTDAFLGKHNDTSYYFHYEQDLVTTLDHHFLASMKTKAEQYVIYADNCLLTKEFRMKHHIIFKKIPRDITRF